MKLNDYPVIHYADTTVISKLKGKSHVVTGAPHGQLPRVPRGLDVARGGIPPPGERPLADLPRHLGVARVQEALWKPALQGIQGTLSA